MPRPRPRPRTLVPRPRPRPRTWVSRPRPRPTIASLEAPRGQGHGLEDSISDLSINTCITITAVKRRSTSAKLVQFKPGSKAGSFKTDAVLGHLSAPPHALPLRFDGLIIVCYKNLLYHSLITFNSLFYRQICPALIEFKFKFFDPTKFHWSEPNYTKRQLHVIIIRLQRISFLMKNWRNDENWPSWWKYWFLTKFDKIRDLWQNFWQNLHILTNEKMAFLAAIWRRCRESIKS